MYQFGKSTNSLKDKATSFLVAIHALRLVAQDSAWIIISNSPKQFNMLEKMNLNLLNQLESMGKFPHDYI